MPPVPTIQTSYNGGELSARMMGRVDQEIYPISAAEMINFVPTVEGPAMKVPGFRYIEPARAGASWLSAFIYSRLQAYVLEWSDLVLRFYSNGTRLQTDPLNPATVIEVAHPFLASEAPFVSQQQSYDRLYLAHPNHPPGALTRTGGASFTYAALTLKDGPFADQNTSTGTFVVASGALTVGGVATINSVTPIFLAGHVGGSFLVEAQDFSDVKAWEAGMDGVVAGTTRVRSDGKVYLAATTGRTGTEQPIHTRGTEYDGMQGLDINVKGPYGVAWTYQHDAYGVGTITAVNSPSQVTLAVTRTIPTSVNTSGSWRWSLPAISAATGYPKLVLLAFGRMIFFTDFEIIASVVGDYAGGSVNMAPFNSSGDFTPDMAFRRRLDISNPILRAKVDRDAILVGTQDGEYAIRKINTAQIFASDNIECVPQSKYGMADVDPVQTGTSTIFVQKNGRKLREANYQFANDRYVAPHINVWQRHILKSGARQLAFQQEPEELLWVVRNDGVLALHPHIPEQEIKGFARRVHGAGAVKSAVAIPGQSGTTDELWVLVDAGGGNLSVEQQAPFWEEGETALADAFFVDSGVTVNPVSLHLTGATWLAGKQVAVLADGGVLPLQTVAADGSIDLSKVLNAVPAKVTIGLPYTARITWLRPELRVPNGGTIQGKRKRLVSIVVRVLETVGIKVDPGTGNPENLIDRPGSGRMDAPIPLFTGDTTSRTLGGGWGYDAQGDIISEDPVPCTVIAHMPQIEIGT